MSPTWIFDLDNTLHQADPYVFPQMNLSMSAYVAQHAGIDLTCANTLRQSYWQRYGSTLAGLQRHHQPFDAEHFLQQTHAFALAGRLLPMPRLKSTLSRLPGRKILFTNSPQHYAHAVLAELGLDPHFADVFAIQHTRGHPKPSLAGYQRLLQRFSLNPRRCIMVEDSLANLAPAKRLGMRTVWLAPHAKRGPTVDLAIHQLADLAKHTSALGR